VRLVTFTARDSGPRIGVVRSNGERVIDLAAAADRADRELPFDPTDMISLIAAGAPALEVVREIEQRAREDSPLAGVKLLAPIPRPRKNVFCVGWNYADHFEEGAMARPHVTEMPKHPAFFTKAPTAVTGPYDAIPYHGDVSQQLDWEVELAVVIGRGGINIAEGDAMGHVFGYTVVNDLSWRDVQRRHGQQWFKGKSLDGTLPMGPWIATADEVDPSDLRVTCRVNGATKQDSSTRHLYFKIPRIIAELSAGMTLEPGDVIATGTPAGVGHARNPPEFMKNGDVVETEIVGLGLLRNSIG
jgi:2-keto-4-pentenoate hydratase/2-oxohepta-3-ene-1,7-dioic acid hydratase in catechol pathway